MRYHLIYTNYIHGRMNRQLPPPPLQYQLPIRSLITIKILLIVYKILDNRAPEYLSELIKLHASCRPYLRSANPDLRILERQDNRFSTNSNGWRAFNVCAQFYFFGMVCF